MRTDRTSTNEDLSSAGVLKPGVATHLCVAKIILCKLSKRVNHNSHTRGWVDDQFLSILK